ncbi:MAG TPA: DNA (cytosine-5-)-methyltransferase, partial [Tissierellaceae bacterium]|nr:DNA (cytosine-5-)-methyltransferase [Tissierellaceae bacterium]
KGIVEGETRSGLLYDALRIIKYKMPKYAIAENVKNLVGKRFKDDFNSLLEELDSYGYNNYWQVLNAKDYGIPQNRERVFIVSIRKDIDKGYEFPKPYDSGLRLKDLLENEVEDKYYIDNDRTNNLLARLKGRELPNQEISYCLDANYYKGTNLKGFLEKKRRQLVAEPKRLGGLHDTDSKKRQSGSIFSKYHIGPTVTTCQGGDDKPMIVEPKRLGGLFDSEDRKRQAGAVWNKEYIAPTIDTCQGGYREPSIIEHDYRIRKLTPKECWRLMGFTDEDYHKARQALEDRFYNGKDRSNSQMYKMAGNSIVVDVLEAIFKELFKREMYGQRRK